MYKRLLLLSAFFMLMLSCKKKNDDNTGGEAITIGGINKRDINANPNGQVGSPDVRTSQNGKSVTAYPNPCADALALSIQLPGGADVLIFLKAARYADASPADVANEDLIGKGILYSTEHQLSTGSNALQLSTSSYANGYYRLYLVTGADTLWDNIQVKH